MTAPCIAWYTHATAPPTIASVKMGLVHIEVSSESKNNIENASVKTNVSTTESDSRTLRPSRPTGLEARLVNMKPKQTAKARQFAPSISNPSPRITDSRTSTAKTGMAPNANETTGGVRTCCAIRVSVCCISRVSRWRTAGFSEPERLTQRKSKRPIEGFVCNPLLPDFSCLHPVR